MSTVTMPVTTKGSPLKLNFLLVFFFILAIALRTLFLGNIPGINGDEALLGIRASGPFDFLQRTNSGNFQNIFYLLPLTFIQQFFPPSVWVLRSVSVLSGLGVIIGGYFLFRSSLSKRTALFFVVLGSAIPILVAYSRFGWEPSQSGLISLFVLYFSLQKKWAGAVIAQLIALIVHPSNALLFFIPLNLFILEVQAGLNCPAQKARVWILIPLGFVIVLGTIVFLNSERLVDMAGWLSEHNLNQIAVALDEVKPQSIIDRMRAPGGWLDLFILYGDLISGVTIYRYIVGPVSQTGVIFHHLLFWLCILPIVVHGCLMKNKSNDYRLTAVFLGTLSGMVMLYMFWGLMPLSPSTERYSQFLVVPTLLLFAAGLDSINIKFSLPLSALVCVFWCVSLVSNYFMPFLLTGGRSERAFRTAEVEPKIQATRIILSDMDGTNRGLILAENWWTAKPIEYLLIGHEGIDVVQFNDVNNTIDVLSALKNNVYVVSFARSGFDKAIEASPIVGNLKRWTIHDYGGKPLIHVWHISP
jgi:hypothetical protein